MIENSAIIILLLTVVSSEHNSATHHRSARQSLGDSCSVPTIKNGRTVVLVNNYIQGSPVPSYASVKFFCNENYALYPNRKLITCDEGSWTDSIPECKLACPPLTSSSVDIQCTYNNKTLNCSNPVVDGTIARCKCKEYYVSLNTYQFPTMKCTRGNWDKLLIECVPECGEGVSKGVANVVKGVAAKFGEFPWHTAIYHLEEDEYVYKCGGSIVNPLIIISAAHCFTDAFGERKSAETYYVSAGKYYSAYESPNDKLSQTRPVKEYHIPPYYRGFDTNYQADIAVVVLKSELQLTSVVRPVCVDWNREFERHQLISNANGSVVGWGYVDPKKPEINEDLKKLTAPFIEISRCLAVVPSNFTRWITPDKFCAGFTNGSSVCQGDSGGGMVFPWTVNNKLKYYLRGIVSVGPIKMDDTCDNYQYGVYTLVTHYSDYIQEVIANNSEVKTQAYIANSFGSCRIPVLENGKLFYLDREYTEGYHIPNYSFLRVSCNENFVLYPEMPYMNCINTTWHVPVPKCKKTCPPLTSALANVSCSVDGKTLDCSNSVVEGTVAEIICKYGSKVYSKCGAGFWSEKDPFTKCEQESMECSKENPANCNSTARPPLDISSCPAPVIENGKYEVLGQHSVSFIPNYSALKISCNSNYTLSPPNTVVLCVNGTWLSEVPKCKSTCPARILSSVDTTCSLGGIPVDCNKPSVEGTVVHSRCKHFYEPFDRTTVFDVSVCIGGEWDAPPIDCVPECGRARINIKNSELLGYNEFPWNIGLYKYENGEYELLCGGSIISPSEVITAAHCVENHNRSAIYIGAGKYHSAYNSSNDLYAQHRQVKQIIISPLYERLNKQADIAMIMVQEPFEISFAVQPICVDWNREFEKEQLKPDASPGKVAGWGSVVGDRLKNLTASYLDTEACLRMVPRDFVRYVTADKFCVSFANGTGACARDSGSGLVFPWTSNYKEKYYITGIVSIGPGPINYCDTAYDPLILFTRFSVYTDWIRKIQSDAVKRAILKRRGNVRRGFSKSSSHSST